MNDWWIIVPSIILPLIGLMFALRPWIKDTVKAEMGELGKEVSRLGEKVSRTEGQLDAMSEYLKECISLYRSLAKPGNPSPNKDELLLKLENDTLTREEAIELQRIMKTEQLKAKQQNDIIRAVVILGILALIAAYLSRVTK